MEPDNNAAEVDWTSTGTGSIKWNGDNLELTGSYVGASYKIVRGVYLNYGHYRRQRGRTPSWIYSYAVVVGRKEFSRRRAMKNHLRRGIVQIGTRTWVLLNDRHVYVTSGKLSALRKWRDNLHMEIAKRLMLGGPSIDWQARSGWTSNSRDTSTAT